SFDGALAAAPDSAAALFGRGSALMELQRWPEALESLDKLLAAAPQHLAALRRRGNVLLELKRFDEALTSYDRALTIAPEDADTLNNLALALLALNRQDEALADLDKALAAKPDDADTWYNSGNVLAALNRFEEALARYDRALAIDPRRATFHNNHGNALRKLDRLEEALASYDGALAIAPDLTDAHYNRGNALVALRRDEEALASYARVLAIEPKHLPARWAMVMHSIPVAAGSREEMEAGRKAFAAGLEDLAAHLADGIDAESAVYQAVPFYLAYHEENNRALYARYGELCVRATGSRPLAERPPRPSSPRLRLGIVSAQVRRHSVWDALLKGIVRHLDPNRIEIDIFHLGALTDAETEWAASRAAHFEQGPHEPRAWVERILARRPDVLLYPEIGMELTTMHLASQRLADVQAATWGHPHTTGLPTIDYFFSAEALEPPDAQDHYTERLVRLPRLGCCFSATELEASPVDLRSLGIEPDRPLLLSPGTPYKYAPQYDWVFPAIAKRLSR